MSIVGLVASVVIKMEGSNAKSCMKFSVDHISFDWTEIMFEPFESSVLNWFVNTGIALITNPLKAAFNRFG